MVQPGLIVLHESAQNKDGKAAVWTAVIFVKHESGKQSKCSHLMTSAYVLLQVLVKYSQHRTAYSAF